MSATTIQWTDVTWNPTTGCTKVSEGCRHCYAETVANRFWKDRKFTDVQTHADRLEQPLHWRKPRKVFTNSMSDLFHEDVPFEFIDKVFAVMALCPQHTFQVLTKRPERMLEYLNRGPMSAMMEEDVLLQRIAKAGTMGHDWPLLNCWLGVSVEDQKTADDRIPILLETPAAVRFVSYEPALGPAIFTSIGVRQDPPIGASPFSDYAVALYWNALSGFRATSMYSGTDNNTHLDWIIVGGESGPKARPFDIEWARSVIRQCKAAGVPCFTKQLGSLPMYRAHGDNNPAHLFNGLQRLHSNGELLRDRSGGDPEEWPEDLRVREFPVGQRKEAQP